MREKCERCGFDGEAWSDAASIEAIGFLGVRWAAAVADLQPDQLERRPLPGTWSIAEYTDHVREVLFAMRFVLDSAINEPGIDLGAPPEPEFSAVPRLIDIQTALDGISGEAGALQQRLQELSPPLWSATAKVGNDEVDAHWICSHAVHDADHHLGDVRRLRAAL